MMNIIEIVGFKDKSRNRNSEENEMQYCGMERVAIRHIPGLVDKRDTKDININVYTCRYNS